MKVKFIVFGQMEPTALTFAQMFYRTNTECSKKPFSEM